MIYHEKWSDQAMKDLEKLDIQMIDRITKKVKEFCGSENPFIFAKALKGQWKGYFRFRVGDYRILFKKDINDQFVIVFILRVGHRKDVYFD